MKALFFMTLILGLCACSHHQSKKNSWADFKTPYGIVPEAIGSSSAGCLAGAQILKEKSDSYIMMRPSRMRGWGHPLLLLFLQELALKTNKELGSLLLIGDLAQARGGSLPGNHVSHQSGLDVDLWFQLPDSLPLDFSREEFAAHSMVKESDLWGSKQEQLLRLIAQDQRVERIFVNPELKKRLCHKYKGAKWLNPIRPWWGHDDHFHVRLQCPATDKQCLKGSAIPTGDGCGKELAWWFTNEAKLPIITAKSTTPVDRTPFVCEQLRANL